VFWRLKLSKLNFHVYLQSVERPQMPALQVGEMGSRSLPLLAARYLVVLVMDNHYHTVLHVNQIQAQSWSMHEVAERWMQLYSGHTLIHRWLKEPETIDKPTMEKVTETIEKWRKRLYDIGWFMRSINECIARMANQEDNCKGRFWEGRFKSQALLDEGAVLSCMTYVDLNPIRADKENSLSTSDFTSIQQRLFDYKKAKTAQGETTNQKATKVLDKRIEKQEQLKDQLNIKKQNQAPLMPFSGGSHTPINIALPFTQEDYFELVDTTGRMIRTGKRGFISEKSPKIIKLFGINPLKWIEHIQNFEKTYGDCCGAEKEVRAFAKNRGARWAKGVRGMTKVYAA